MLTPESGSPSARHTASLPVRPLTTKAASCKECLGQERLPFCRVGKHFGCDCCYETIFIFAVVGGGTRYLS